MKRIAFTIIMLLEIVGGLFAKDIPTFKDGDRIVFVGNSITCGGRYHSYIWLYYMTHFPNMHLTIVNEGIGGDDAFLMSQRLNEVFEHKPTILSLSFGMNDTGYVDFTNPQNKEWGNQRVKDACKAYSTIEEAFKHYSGAEKILIGSSPYDNTMLGNKDPFPEKNIYVQQISDFMKKRADVNQWGFVDFNYPMVKINLNEQRKDPTFTLCGNDRIHPTANGHLIMAYLFLKAQGMANKPVADIGIDALSEKIWCQENCTITDLTVSSDKKNIGFMYQANSLPFPIERNKVDYERYAQADALNHIPFMKEMNYEGLTISGLPKGEYKLLIGGKEIVQISSDKLKKGINLADYENTPQYEQARKIGQMNEQRWRLERELREYYCVEYNLFKEKDMLWGDNEAAVDTLLKYQNKNVAINMAKNYWLRFAHKSVRIENKRNQKHLLQRIYQENKPQKLEIKLVKIL